MSSRAIPVQQARRSKQQCAAADGGHITRLRALRSQEIEQHVVLELCVNAPTTGHTQHIEWRRGTERHVGNNAQPPFTPHRFGTLGHQLHAGVWHARENLVGAREIKLRQSVEQDEADGENRVWHGI